jgi:hypothetical protein
MTLCSLVDTVSTSLPNGIRSHQRATIGSFKMRMMANNHHKIANFRDGKREIFVAGDDVVASKFQI